MNLLHIYDDPDIKKLYHQAGLGNLTTVDMTIAVEKEPKSFSNNQDYFYFLEFKTTDIYNKNDTYRSPEQKLTLPKKLEKQIGCTMLEELVSLGAAYSLSQAAREIAGYLSDYGCAITYEGKPYNQEMIDKKVSDAKEVMGIVGITKGFQS